jgi:hypothetical protein
MTTSIKVFAFRAIDYPEISHTISCEHNKRLLEFKINGLTSSSDTWLSNPSVYCICAIDEDRNKILGAIRIQIADLIYRMPIEYALRRFNINIQYLIKNLMQNRIVGESCGLWCANENIVKRTNLSLKLIIFQIALCTHLNVFHFFAFTPNHTINKFYETGFTKHELFLDYFNYPNEKYQSRVLHMIPSNLEHTNEEVKNQIFMILGNPNYVETLEFEGESVIIKYQLTLLRPQYSHALLSKCG